MASDRIIQMFEHDELRVGDRIGDVRIDERDRELLSRLHRQTQYRYFDLIDRGIKLKQYVGVLKVGNLVIEILPKGDKVAKKNLNAAEKLPWRTLFVQLLNRVGFINTELGPKAELYLQHGSLLDLYVEHFLKAVSGLCRQGLVRAYIPRVRTRESLKGQIQFSRQMVRELRGTLGFDTRAAEYERGHVLNRLLATALRIVQESKLSCLAHNTLPEVVSYFEGISPLQDTMQLVKALQFDRRTERYRMAIDLAKPILLSALPGVRAGADDTFSMFFDMNRVWERYIFCELRRYAQSCGITVDRQVIESFWEGRTVRPDIVVHLDAERRVVIDTKWKELTRPEPSDSDLRQMFTYNHQIAAGHSILLYPDIHGLEGRGDRFKTRAGFADHGCSFNFARIWKHENGKLMLNSDIGREVLAMAAAV
jgi:5-methylcytosine-specific restriction enzyme subunit McrC